MTDKVNLPEGQREGGLGREVVAVRSIEIVTAEIHTIRDNVARVFMDGVVQIGRRLEEAKQLVPQGEWMSYLDTQLGYKPSTAQNYMRIAREFGDGQVGLSGKTASDFFGNLGYSQLLPLLGMPDEEREALRAEVAAAQAKAVQAAEARAAEAQARLEKVKNPAAHRVNFLFGELCEYWSRLQEALQALEQSDEEAAGKMSKAIVEQMRRWTA